MPATNATIGAACALTTAFAPDGHVDAERTVGLARRAFDHGCRHVGLFGTTGEGASLDLVDRRDILEAAHASGIPSNRLIIGVSSSAVGDAAATWRLARDAGCAYVLVPPPFYYKEVSDEGLLGWYVRLIETAGDAACPAILYTIPSVTSVALSVDLIGRLKTDFPDIVVAVKDSTGQRAHTQALLAAHGDLQILVGSEPDLAAMMRKGAAGAISGVANVLPESIARTVETHEDDDRISTLVAALLRHPVTPAVKALVAHVMRDPEWQRARPPLVELAAAEAANLRGLFDDLFAAKST
ncbi:MAG TPA: dihydrodipicolinate synthase family protein [Alphaproteobacteria bacterium]|nr:dihydrodipicolinate synthase family protein [Alphaproteobacteria bacterium]